MKDVEAHEYLENKQRMMTHYRFAFTTIEVEANGQAILALEKQIPKKPVIRKGEAYSIYYDCPKCKGYLVSLLDGNWCAGNRYNYCPFCGQVLDWSDTNG